MVRLTKIYTKTGDQGRTRLGDMSEVDKTDIRVEAYGSVDEANAVIGVARRAVEDEAIDALLARIQNEMFDLGADLCVPDTGEDPGFEPLRMTAKQVEALEAAIDAWNGKLDPLDSFILPAGSEASARLHLARTVCRRAERRTVALQQVDARLNPETVRYLNRLSDLLFVLARIANDEGRADVKWVPGASRD
ncbi:cob(I)yrinic acid a,c-diamide adenosyltransferase [Hyphobacterium sp. CCMP332]|uniref:cob(I)yrinic acid a,c-diamide adenosyltransferase n=1 Tax=Hyphobacterium sp. CCMP332 TaxID=2749086 RepID=UPI00164F8109|nr:cob(I)yrinic acid a,c-diamide adenosyltransferase [Hyphobacterium sp. CCMP332]QNL18007.1 cob(I)yrinic acid a,c-diamide adenosyltransferase [Hyphobacterium sp. CCMP332]